jgi:hypothetical protein
LANYFEISKRRNGTYSPPGRTDVLAIELAEEHIKYITGKGANELRRIEEETDTFCFVAGTTKEAADSCNPGVQKDLSKKSEEKNVDGSGEGASSSAAQSSGNADGSGVKKDSSDAEKAQTQDTEKDASNAMDICGEGSGITAT